MMFCGSTSASGGATAPSVAVAIAFGSTGTGSALAATGASVFVGAGGSSVGRIFEIGGRNALLVFTSPSFDSLGVLVLSMSETDGADFAAAAGLEGVFGEGCAFAGAGAGFFSGSAFFLGTIFALAVAGPPRDGLAVASLRATADLAPEVFGAGFRVAVLLVVFVAISDFAHGSCVFNRARLLRFPF